MIEDPDNIVIIARGKTLAGETVITYCTRDDPEYRRIKIVEEEHDLR